MVPPGVQVGRLAVQVVAVQVVLVAVPPLRALTVHRATRGVRVVRGLLGLRVVMAPPGLRGQRLLRYHKPFRGVRVVVEVPVAVGVQAAAVARGVLGES
jgi:hypothetical protein